MASHHPAKFDDQRHCDSGDIKLSMIKEEDLSACLNLR